MSCLRPLGRESLAQRVARQIERHAASCRPGERLPPESALAERLGVSVRTVREAVGQLVVQGRLDRRHGSGTYVLAPPARRVAILTDLDLQHPSTSYFFVRTTAQCQAQLGVAGREVRIYLGGCTAGDDTGGYPGFTAELAGGTLAAAIVLGGCESLPWMQWAQAGLKVIGGDAQMPLAVLLDRRDALQRAAAWCAAQGRRRVAVLLHGRSDDAIGATLLQALAEQGLAPHPRRIAGGYRPAPTEAAALFDAVWRGGPGRPDALIVTDDLLFRDILGPLLASGVNIPSDLSVVAHGNRGSGITAPFPHALMQTDPDLFAAALVKLTTDVIDRGICARQDTVAATFLPPGEAG